MNTPRYDPEKHHRRSVRWRGRDYSQDGAYFVTLCARGREHLFGAVADGAMRLNAFGEIVAEEWLRCAETRPEIKLDAFVVMPNHFHGIVWIARDVGAQRAVPHDKKGHSTAMPLRPHRTAGFQNVIPGSLGAIVRAFKSASTKRINIFRRTPGAPVWQRNYYERVLRDRKELHRTQWYVEQNPAQWAADRENPDRRGKSDAWETFLYGVA